MAFAGTLVTLNNLLAFSLDGSPANIELPVIEDGAVTSIEFAGDRFYIGGNFTLVGGKERSNLAAINPDGTLSDWAPSANLPVRSLGVADDVIYIGGEFTFVQDVNRNFLAALNAQGDLLNWSPSSNYRVKN